MGSSSIELPGCEIASIEQNGDDLRVHFSKAYLIQSMSGSQEQTRWWQAGSLIFEQIQELETPPQGPLVCDGGDVGENIYTYRDMIPVPLQSRGQAHCDLRFKNQQQHLKIQASGVRLEMLDRPHYIEHIRPDSD